mmetsp:Transcript_24566/g.59234  ORF Transcript_24566/g.59234 Transcript_24566/m.59234 type:complete len:286 (+) Transcript_24566:581-1438(+)
MVIPMVLRKGTVTLPILHRASSLLLDTTAHNTPLLITVSLDMDRHQAILNGDIIRAMVARLPQDLHLTRALPTTRTARAQAQLLTISITSTAVNRDIQRTHILPRAIIPNIRIIRVTDLRRRDKDRRLIRTNQGPHTAAAHGGGMRPRRTLPPITPMAAAAAGAAVILPGLLLRRPMNRLASARLRPRRAPRRPLTTGRPCPLPRRTTLEDSLRRPVQCSRPPAIPRTTVVRLLRSSTRTILLRAYTPPTPPPPRVPPTRRRLPPPRVLTLLRICPPISRRGACQ